MRNEFGDFVPEVPFTEENKVVEAFISDGSNETLGVRVAVRTASRDFNALDPSRPQGGNDGGSEERISVVDQVLGIAQKAGDWIGDVASDLVDPLGSGVDRDATDMDGAFFSVNEEV